MAGQGIERVYSLPGGHVKPIWHELDAAGIQIVSTRHEGAAVHMAQADADLSDRLAVAVVTAGPGLTNAVSALACADLARSPVLVISARPPRPQAGMGALEEIPQEEIVRPITRRSTAVADARHVLTELDLAVGRALGYDGPQGPAYLDFPTDMLGELAPPAYAGTGAYRLRGRPLVLPAPEAVEEAARLLRESKRPLVIAGAAAKRNPDALRTFLRRTGALFLDTRASRGALPADEEAHVPAVRAQVMAEADLVITLGRELDFELAFGSPAVFSAPARFVRIGESLEEVVKNRRGDAEVVGDVWAAIDALLVAGAAPADPDRTWRDELIAGNQDRVSRLQERLAEAGPDSNGQIHPYAVLGALNDYIDDETVVIVDGGDTLAFARLGLRTPTYLDLGPFGCLGVGVPFANAAAIKFPDRRILAVIGDGSFGFHAMEVETAVREQLPVTLVVMNNSAWNIERYDEIAHYGSRILGTELSSASYSALAESLGAHGERVQDQAELRPALERAFAAGTAVVDVQVSREAISPDSGGGLALVPPLQALRAWEAAERDWLDAESNSNRRNAMAVDTHEVDGREPARGYSEVTSGGGVVAISGQLPSKEVLEGSAGFVEQFASAMGRFVEAVSAVGATTADVLMMRIYVTSVADYSSNLKELAPAYRSNFDQYPATTLVEVSALIDERAAVEIEGLAIQPSGAESK